jgi:hypothetical protein
MYTTSEHVHLPTPNMNKKKVRVNKLKHLKGDGALKI